MFSKEYFINLALESEAKYNELTVLYPAGTINEERNDAYRMAEKAMFCAEYMEKQGIEEIANIAGFTDPRIDLIRKGDKIKIKKGSEIRSTHPSLSKTIAKQVRNITVDSIDKGYVLRSHCFHDNESPIGMGKVTWVGTGSYWFWTDINNIILD